MTEPRAITIPHAAEMLQMSRATIYRRIQDGTIRAIKIGSLVRIPISEIERLTQPSA